MSIASPPDIDICDAMHDSDSNNRKCHFVNKDGLPFCGCMPRRLGPVHLGNAFNNPCAGCGYPRCVTCTELFLVSR